MIESIPWFAWIPIVAIVCGCITGVVRMNHCHTERIEMIRQGMHPDGHKPVGPPEL